MIDAMFGRFISRLGFTLSNQNPNPLKQPVEGQRQRDRQKDIQTDNPTAKNPHFFYGFKLLFPNIRILKPNKKD